MTRNTHHYFVRDVDRIGNRVNCSFVKVPSDTPPSHIAKEMIRSKAKRFRLVFSSAEYASKFADILSLGIEQIIQLEDDSMGMPVVDTSKVDEI